MTNFVNWMDGHSKVVKIIFCIWILDIFWAVYRIGRAAVAKNWLHMVLGIIWVFLAFGFIGFILDLIWIILKNRIFWFERD